MKCMIAQNLISSLCLCEASSVYYFNIYSMFFASLFTCNRNQTTTTTVTISVEFPLSPNYCAFCVCEILLVACVSNVNPRFLALHAQSGEENVQGTFVLRALCARVLVNVLRGLFTIYIVVAQTFVCVSSMFLIISRIRRRKRFFSVF